MAQPTNPHRPHDTRDPAPIRVSTYVHGRHDDAITRQQDTLLAWIADQPGYQLSGQYVDMRPNQQTPRFGLRRALVDARTGRYDVLLVHDLSRLTRRMPELARILHALDRARVVLRSADDTVDTSSPVGRLFARMVVAFADFDIAAPRLPSSARGGRRRPTREPRSRDRDRSGRRSTAEPE
ncbi:recombinase family protein [Virgisporangium aurantiacum]|uniref:Resolvase/invertase-type recombinase catalytic domain-containing protein n=1 Tax=Virgisporangium aurantiacum TaxID=175570 RepID=A0A8J3ZDD2_9ACTN|nr:recombinase family protein [Virgisporangium aurantiacum]GIJ59138.1 hypothetical protein Vau01_066540 [Virgisporangium aurantiacum]